ncbi:MAG: adenylyltransferase/cytidyltransferase family protein [Crocinitomicaceae bacterium]|nr:adenylyltransferase/cytidyltransferase family protein [Crocinitomicaceae bacterium]
MNSRLEHLQSKIVDHKAALQRMYKWKMQGHKVVFTNGCFDLLHTGHVSYLSEAADRGNRMVVALNTDASVKRQGKGDDRPVNNEDARAIVIAGLSAVEMVVFFDDDTPLELIKRLNPDVLAKGADYDPDETDTSSKTYIVGSDFVKSNGGEVVAIPLVEGFSTTAVIEKLRG